MQVYLIIYAYCIVGDIGVVDDDGVDEAGTLDETKEGVGCSDHVAILALQLGHETRYEDYAACDREGQGEDG